MEHVAADVLGSLGALVAAGPVRLDPTDRRVRVQVDVDAVVRTQLEVQPRLGGNLPQRDDPLVEDGTRGGVLAERAAPDQVLEECPVVVGDEVGPPDPLLPVAAHRANVLPEPEGKQALVERRHHQPGAEVDLGALALRDRCRFGCRHQCPPTRERRCCNYLASFATRFMMVCEGSPTPCFSLKWAATSRIRSSLVSALK